MSQCKKAMRRLDTSVYCHKAAYYSCRKRFTILPVTIAVLVTLEVCIDVSSMEKKISRSRDLYCRYLSSIWMARISKRHRARSDEWLQLIVKVVCVLISVTDPRLSVHCCVTEPNNR